MLSQKFQRRDAETRRKWELSIFRFFTFRCQLSILNSLALCLCVSVVNLSCGSKPTDLRTVIPADALVYLETNDLGRALRAVTENEAFRAVAKTEPDLSALNGMKLSVAVTGFQTTEQAVTEENSILSFKPRFVAVAETNAWNYQALSFTENKLGEFINETYGGEVVLETSDKHSGKYFVWTAKDGRKAYALVRGSLIFFGNDESAINKCLAVTRGEADSISKNPKITALPAESLASGNVSTDGVAQIANIVGVKFANEAGEAPEVQTAIARILPQLLRNSIKEVSWTATLTDQGIEDKYVISMPSEIANVFIETFRVAESNEPNSNRTIANIAQIPANAKLVTRYNLDSPQVAWRSVLLVAGKKLDTISAAMFSQFADLLFTSYSIRDPEAFLASIESPKIKSPILTVRFDVEGDEPVLIYSGGDLKETVRSLLAGFRPPKSLIEGGTNIWVSRDGDFQARFGPNGDLIGTKELLDKFGGSELGELSTIKTEPLKRLALSDAPITTVGEEETTCANIAEFFSEKKSDDAKAVSTYLTETRFTKTGIERRTVSDFGLIGSIIEQLGKEN